MDNDEILVKMNEILSAVRELAKTQRLYGHLLRDLMKEVIKVNDHDEEEEIVETIEIHHF